MGKMLKIGEFAALSSMSIHMLRNYDKIGILVPEYVDEINGYRYYDKSQLVKANQINAWKTMGFGLEQMQELLTLDQSKIELLMEEKRREKVAELTKIGEQIHQIESMLQDSERVEKITNPVVRNRIESTWVISLRSQIASYPMEGILWEELTKACTQQTGKTLNAKSTKSSIAMAFYHDQSEASETIDVEVMLTLDGEYTSFQQEYELEGRKAVLSVYRLESMDMASVIFEGSYSQISKINLSVADWLEKNQLVIVGPSFCIYHRSPENCVEEQKFVTQICFPIRG